MSKSPAFQFYPHDFLAGRVATYGLETVGAYIMLLSFDWSLDGLPFSEGEPTSLGQVCPKLSRNSLQTFAKLCRTSTRKFERMWVDLHAHFVVCEDGKMRNQRLQREREKQLAYSQSMSSNGKRGGRPPKPQESRGLAAVKPDESTPSPTPSPKDLTTSADVRTVLDRFLALHPRRRIGKNDPKRVARALAFGYSAAELCEALEGNAADEWHVTQGKHELEYVLRNEGKIDDFRAKLEASRPKLAVDPATGLPNSAGLKVMGMR